ncbi:MAG TPA: N,N-dimethylformamidase beta subunit family domain-containing protein [Verrucomicrobiae bacterium]|nr:N,N-dimethylformamidase beta subunit family domain-containing protein [Verrucomicrobiae bacterium]
MKHRSAISRRDALKAIAIGSLAGCATAPEKGAADVIRNENARPGTRDWMLTKTAVAPETKYRCPWIEGYCSRTSLRAGETIEFFVSTNPATTFRIEIYRMGFYGGEGGRKMTELGPFRGVVQPDPEIGPKRLRECKWDACASLKIPRDWTSGVYLGKLTAEREGFQSYVIFIVRDDRRADFILQCSDTTWQAYNRWPNQFSLYDDGKNTWYWGPGVDISFDRPYRKYCQILDAPLSTGSGEFFLWEFPMVYWLEQNGYDITYISNLDVHGDPKNLRRAKGFISIGHDEYYSMEMFNHLRGAIDDGLSVGFFSGNVCCGRIDPRPSSSGVANRIFSRVDFWGPRDEAEIKSFPTMGLLPHQSPNSNLLVGAGNIAPTTGGSDFICSKPDHWIFEATGMRAGDGIPGLVGWEWHGGPAAIAGLEIVSTGPTQSSPGKLNGGVYTATIYPGPKGNFVFNASSCWWADGLSAPPGYVRPSVYTTPKGPDVRAQKITANVLRRMIG